MLSRLHIYCMKLLYGDLSSTLYGSVVICLPVLLPRVNIAYHSSYNPPLFLPESFLLSMTLDPQSSPDLPSVMKVPPPPSLLLQLPHNSKAVAGFYYLLHMHSSPYKTRVSKNETCRIKTYIQRHRCFHSINNNQQGHLPDRFHHRLLMDNVRS